MAKRFTDTDQWDKEWFMQLPPHLKCLCKLIRDKCDLSGVWSPNWFIANAYINSEIKITEEDLLKIDGGKQFKKIDGGKILCIGFIQFQYGQLSEKSPVHRKILSILIKHNIPYQHPINRVKEEDKDKEEEKIKAMEEKKEGDPNEIWTEDILTEKDFKFSEMAHNELSEVPEPDWIKSHLVKCNREKWVFDTQQKFRQSLIAFLKTCITNKKSQNGIGKKLTAKDRINEGKPFE